MCDQKCNNTKWSDQCWRHFSNVLITESSNRSYFHKLYFRSSFDPFTTCTLYFPLYILMTKNLPIWFPSFQICILSPHTQISHHIPRTLRWLRYQLPFAECITDNILAWCMQNSIEYDKRVWEVRKTIKYIFKTSFFSLVTIFKSSFKVW